MFSYLHFPFISTGLVVLLLTAVASLPRFHGRSPRRLALYGLSLSIIAFSLALVQITRQPGAVLLDPALPWLKADALDALHLVLYPLVAAVAICLAPRRDIKLHSLTGILLLVLGTEIIYASANLLLMNMGWWLTCLPFVLGMFGDSPDRKHTRIALVSSAVMLSCATFLFRATDMNNMSHISHLCLFFLILTVIIRKGLFPLHRWTLQAFDTGPLLPKSLLFNSHLGALLVARAESASLPDYAYQVLNWLSILALVTALVTSLRGFVENKPRRMLALVCTSQASFILSGLLAPNAVGVMGGMLHWIVVMLASTGLIAIVRILEVRVLDVADPSSHLGLAVRAPRLATFFLICGLALVGMPGTMGYCAEDLLFHGVQDHHPVIGISLLLATAFNAINLMRLYSVLFLGVLPKNVIEIPDALPRERWPLVLVMALLIVGGIYPALPVALRSQAMQTFHLEPPHASGH
jgi:NADH-quinone oxidoreductase subunit M